MSAAGEGVAFNTHHANRFHHIFPITEGFSRIGLTHNDVQAVAHLLACCNIDASPVAKTLV